MISSLKHKISAILIAKKPPDLMIRKWRAMIFFRRLFQS